MKTANEAANGAAISPTYSTASKRRFNFRAPLVSAAALAFGVFLAFVFAKYGVAATRAAMFLPASAPVYIYLRFCVKRKTAAKAFLIFTVFAALGFILAIRQLLYLSVSEIADGGIYDVSGKIAEIYRTDGGGYAVLEGVTADGRHIAGKIQIFLDEAALSSLGEGDIINFSGELSKYDPIAYGELSYYAQHGIKYVCYDCLDIAAEYRFSLYGVLRKAIREALYSNLDAQTAGILLAMLTGNSHGVGEGTLEAFRRGGVAHIFAVSGLHIGIVFGAVNGLLRLCRVGKRPAALISSAAVFFYSGLCCWTLSSVRASIMCAVSATCSAGRKKYDGLSSLSLAVTIVLIIAPLSLFNVGFQLSVCAVLCIALFSNGILRTLKFLPRPVRSAIAVSLSSSLGTWIILLNTFGYISAAGLLLNVVFIPVISLLFTYIFAATIIAAIIPPAGIVLTLCALPFEALLSFLVGFGAEAPLIKGFGAGAFIALYFLFIFLLSDKLNIRALTRAVALATTAALAATYVTVRIFAGWNGYTIVAASRDGEICVVVKSASGGVVIFSDGADADFIYDTAFGAYCLAPKAYIVLGEMPFSALSEIGLDCQTVYIFEQIPQIFLPEGYDYRFMRQFSACGIEFGYVDGRNLSAEVGGVTVCVCTGGIIPFSECDLLISSSLNEYCAARRIVYPFDAYGELSTYKSGALTFRAEDGKLRLLSSPP